MVCPRQMGYFPKPRPVDLNNRLNLRLSPFRGKAFLLDVLHFLTWKVIIY
jgi:hypothetical protein